MNQHRNRAGDSSASLLGLVVSCRPMSISTLGSSSISRSLRPSLLLLLMAGCSRGGVVDGDPVPDLAMPEGRHDLGGAGGDLGGPADLGGSAACPAPCWLNPQPQGNNLSSVWREPGGDGWAVGFGPSLVRLEKGSARVVRTVRGSGSYYLLGIWGSSPSDVWAVGTSNTALHYDGKDWALAPIDTSGYLGLTSVWGSGPKDIWAVGFSGAIRHYDGSTWQTVASGTTANLKSVHGTGDKSAFAVGESGALLRWNGTAWSSTPGVTGSTLNRVRCAAANDCLAVGEQATALRWDGTKWTALKTTGLYDTFLGLVALGPSDYLVTGYKTGGTSTYRFDGKVFNEVVSAGFDISDVAGASADDLIGVGFRGNIGRWNGLSWTPLSFGTTEILLSAWATSATEMWMTGAGSGNGGHLLRWDGANLTSFDAPVRTVYTALWGSSASSVWAIGYEGNIARWNGSRWAAEPKLTTSGLTAIAGSGPNSVWVAADLGVLLHYDGTSWSAQPSLGSVAILGLWLSGSGPGDGWAVGSSGSKGVLWRFDGSKWNPWAKQFDSQLRMVWGSGSKDVWAAGEKGLLVHFDGTEWTQQTSPATADIYALRGSGPADVWMSTFGGSAYRWSGTAWSPVFTDAQVSLNGLAMLGSQVLAVGENGAILRLTP